jgi:hypothetical protein
MRHKQACLKYSEKLQMISDQQYQGVMSERLIKQHPEESVVLVHVN